jgi:DNA-binding NarL/FixJ family response regulator
MDIDMPHMNGIEGVTEVRKIDTYVKILMLTVFEDNKNVFEAIKAGANGYLLKKNSFERLTTYIKDAHNGGAPMSATIATQVLKMFTFFSLPSSNLYNLSEREKEVLQLLVEGNSYKMVAAEMRISIDTVRSHIRNIYDKLHVNSKSEAVAKAIKGKIV